MFPRRLGLEQLESRWLMDASADAIISPESVGVGPHGTPGYFATSDELDVNGDGAVSSLDVLDIVNALNKGDSSARLDVSGDLLVSPLDALRVINEINRAGNAVLLTPPTDEEIHSHLTGATQFAAEISTVLPESELIDLIASDFAKIHRVHPELGLFTQSSSGEPGMLPGMVAVFLDEEAWAKFSNNAFVEFERSNEELGATSITPSLRRGLTIEFDDPYNSTYLAERYRELPGVQHAQNHALAFDFSPHPRPAVATPRFILPAHNARAYDFVGFGPDTRIIVTERSVFVAQVDLTLLIEFKQQ